MDAELRTLIKQRGNLKSKLTKFSKYVDKFNSETDNIQNIIFRYEELPKLMEQFDQNKLQIDLKVGEGEESESEWDEFENSYYDCKTRAKLIIDANSAKTPYGNQLTPSANTHQPAKLPEVKLPTFDGKYDEWLTFKDIYYSLVDSNNSLSDVDKFRYLKSALRGEAAKVIGSIAITTENYQSAWNKIVTRFEDKEGIILKHIKNLVELESVNRESHMSLRELADEISNHLDAVKTLETTNNLTNRLLVYLISKKLDSKSRHEWETHIANIKAPTVEYMLEFLINRSKLLEKLGYERRPVDKQKFNKQHSSGQRPGRNSIANYMALQSTTCAYCKQEHFTHVCDTFIGLTYANKVEAVKKMHLCFNCLKKGHGIKECKSKNTCRTCNKRHHTLLHADIARTPAENRDNPAPSTSTTVVAHCASQLGPSVVLATAMVGIKSHHGNYEQARLILDSGSQANFITTELCTRLNLPRATTHIPVTGINNSVTKIQHYTNVHLKSNTSNFETSVPCLIIDKLIDHLPNEHIDISNLQIPRNIKLADRKFHIPEKVDMLIGANLFWDVLANKQIKLHNSSLILHNTKLGFIVAGSHYSSVIQVKCNVTTMEKIHTQISQFWEIENCDYKKRIITREESICEKHYVKTTRRQSDGRFIVNIPFKSNISELGLSHNTALRRFYALETKLNKNNEMKIQYTNFMTEYIKLGHMHQLSNPQPEVGYFIPHHSVNNPNSITSKFRVVFNASTKTSSGLSLNDVQMTGPALQTDIVNLLIRFRQHKYVIKADISKMYRQILIDPDQRKYQKILWRANSDEPVQAFQLNTVTYGTGSAPYLAIRTIKQIAAECKVHSPDISRILENDMFVDDLLTGSDSINQVLYIKNEITKILSQAGFELHKWQANDGSILIGNDNHILIGSDSNSLHNSPLPNGNELKTLGIYWCSRTDHLYYNIDIGESKTITKRIILSHTATIFDPLGLLGPIIIIAKILIQKLWQASIGWDDVVPGEIQQDWAAFIEGLRHIHRISIPRKVVCDNHISVEIHGFCDSSEVAYGATIYVRSINHANNIQVSLLCAKSRVAPLKRLTLPRLELCGAVLLARLYKTVISSLTLTIDRKFFWTDSTIALSWIRGCPTRWTQFVSHRVAEIQELTDESNWRHVPSADNPADTISRGHNTEKLINSTLWWNGPSFLRNNESTWPQLLTTSEIPLPDEKIIKTNFITQPTDDEFNLITRFSSFLKLLRVTGYIMRYSTNCKRSVHKKSKITGPLTTNEMRDAELTLIRFVQEREFGEELLQLKTHAHVKHQSRISSLAPFLDGKNILRVGGRIKHSDFAYEHKYPAILPRNHFFTKLIIVYKHQSLLHAGVENTLAAVRMKYWPIAGRTCVKEIIRSCVTCTRSRPKLLCPIMGDLPNYRVTASRPFKRTSVDYAGPFFIKEGRYKRASATKMYVAVFVCMATKAVHIEVVRNLTTESFLAVLHRFIARRGLPSDIYSDNGKTFVGANNELKGMQSLFQSEIDGTKIVTELSGQSIEWHFIPPRTPHMGGLWEAAVKSVKTHLTRIAGNANLSSDAFVTLLTQIEAILNSRPLTPLSDDPNDTSCLTPGHFLIGDSMLSPPHPDVTHIASNRLSQWQHILQLRQHFWRRWSQEYISLLQQRSKWKKHTCNIQLGQLVVVKDDHLPPLRWMLGRVIDLHPGSDGVVRVVSIQTAQSVVKRAVNRVCVLPVDPRECRAPNNSDRGSYT